MNVYTWLDDKKVDDGAEGLWRIHDELYDFSDFIKQHPGGGDWLVLTKVDDCDNYNFSYKYKIPCINNTHLFNIFVTNL